MKTVFGILGTALIIITACMVFISFQGVGLRTEPIIKPSPIDDEYHNISFGITHRMFADFQNVDFAIFDLSRIPKSQYLLSLIVENKKIQLNNKRPSVVELDSTLELSEELLLKCEKPCWFVYFNNSQEVNFLELINRLKVSKGSNYFTLSAFEFERNVAVPEICEKQHRLDVFCIRSLAVREAQRFMKKSDVRYFFMRRYDQVDYYLFLEKSLSK